jgi:hypothetical protein
MPRLDGHWSAAEASASGRTCDLARRSCARPSFARKFGEQSEVAKAVDGVEARPDSAGRKQTLAEEVAAARAERDPEVRQAAQALLEQLQAHPGGERHIQQATCSYIAQADRASTASVNVGRPEPGAPPKA